VDEARRAELEGVGQTAHASTQDRAHAQAQRGSNPAEGLWPGCVARIAVLNLGGTMTNAYGDTMGVELAQTAAQGQANGVAGEIRRLGEEAFRLGEKIRNDAEGFAQEELRAVTEMETFLRKGLARLRHIEQTMRKARAPAAPQAIEPPPEEDVDDRVNNNEPEIKAE